MLERNNIFSYPNNLADDLLDNTTPRTSNINKSSIMNQPNYSLKAPNYNQNKNFSLNGKTNNNSEPENNKRHKSFDSIKIIDMNEQPNFYKLGRRVSYKNFNDIIDEPKNFGDHSIDEQVKNSDEYGVNNVASDIERDKPKNIDKHFGHKVNNKTFSRVEEQLKNFDRNYGNNVASSSILGEITKTIINLNTDAFDIIVSKTKIVEEHFRHKINNRNCRY